MRVVPVTSIPHPAGFVFSVFMEHFRHAHRRKDDTDRCKSCFPKPKPVGREYRCRRCHRPFASLFNLTRHVKRVHEGRKTLRAGELKPRR